MHASNDTSAAASDVAVDHKDGDTYMGSDLPEEGQEVRDQALALDKYREKRLVRKTDWLLLPVLTALFFFIGLERLSIANAKTDGIEEDLGLVGNQYYLCIMLGYVPLCLSSAPLAMLTRWIPIPRYIALQLLFTGILGIATAYATSFGGLLTIRLLLGFVEGPLMPLVIGYLTKFYQRGELAVRLGIWYSAVPFSGCVAGLLSYGVFGIESSTLKGWQILFLIEGSVCTAFSIFAFFYLPESPDSCWFYSAEEKAMQRVRLLMDGTHDIQEVTSWSDAYRPFIQDWRYLVWAVLAFGLGVPLASVMNYIPQITSRLGYGKLTTNLLTAGPFLANTIFSIAISFSSDHFRERSLHLALPLTVTSIGFILLRVLPTSASRTGGYFATFMICIGCLCPSPLLSTWYSNNTISQTHRTVLAAVMVAIANSAGVVSGNIYMKGEEADGYPTALVTTAAVGAVTALGVVVFGMYMRRENARRNTRQGKPKSWGSQDVPTKVLGLGHKSEDFRYMY